MSGTVDKLVVDKLPVCSRNYRYNNYRQIGFQTSFEYESYYMTKYLFVWYLEFLMLDETSNQDSYGVQQPPCSSTVAHLIENYTRN